MHADRQKTENDPMSQSAFICGNYLPETPRHPLNSNDCIAGGLNKMAIATQLSTLAPRFSPYRLRRTILNMAYAGSTVHVACAFSIVEILAVLYRSYLRLDMNDPRSPERDYLVLSKGHGVMAQYACMHELGWIADDELRSYFRDGTRLKGLADAHLPGVEASGGSLGHGLSVGVGLAMAAKRRCTGQ